MIFRPTWEVEALGTDGKIPKKPLVITFHRPY